MHIYIYVFFLANFSTLCIGREMLCLPYAGFCFVLTGFAKFRGKSGSPEHVDFFLGAISVSTEKAYKVDIIPFPLCHYCHHQSILTVVNCPSSAQRGSGNIAPGQCDTAPGQTVWCPRGLVTATPDPCWANPSITGPSTHYYTCKYSINAPPPTCSRNPGVRSGGQVGGGGSWLTALPSSPAPWSGSRKPVGKSEGLPGLAWPAPIDHGPWALVPPKDPL